MKKQGDGFALTFTVDERQALKRIQTTLGTEPKVEIQPINLEDLFIDWTGGHE